MGEIADKLVFHLHMRQIRQLLILAEQGVKHFLSRLRPEDGLLDANLLGQPGLQVAQELVEQPVRAH